MQAPSANSKLQMPYNFRTFEPFGLITPSNNTSQTYINKDGGNGSPGNPNGSITVNSAYRGVPISKEDLLK